MNLDAASRARLRLLYPDFSVRVVRVVEDFTRLYSRTLRVLEGVRTFPTQASRYAVGRTSPGRDVSENRPMGRTVTNSPPGLSMHHYGSAADLVFAGLDPYLEKDPRADETWDNLARIGEAHGLRAGRRFHSLVDSPHFELPYGGIRVQDCLALYHKGGIESVWREFDRIRGVPPGSEWFGPIEKNRLIAMGQLVGEVNSAYDQGSNT